MTHSWNFPRYWIRACSKESSSSSSSRRAACTDLRDPLKPPVSIVRRSREVFPATSYIGTELLYIGSSWLPYFCSSMWRGLQEHIAFELVLISPAVSCMSASSTLDIFVMSGRWLCSCCFLGCSLQNLFSMAHSILALLSSSFFSIRLASVHVVHPYSSMDTSATWKKLPFILSVRSDFLMTDILSLAGHTFTSRVLMSFSVHETLLPR